MNDLEGKKGLQFIYFNARSLCPKLGAIRHDLINKHVGVVGITETWLSDETDSFVAIPGYQIYRNDRIYGRGGGTCVYIRNDLYSTAGTRSISQKLVEIQNITLTGERGSGHKVKPIEVVLIYCPPRGRDVEAFELIVEFISNITQLENKDLLIMGDLNWDYLDKSNLGSKMIDDLMSEFDLTLHVNISTRVSKEKSSLLDLLLSNIKNVSSSGCIDYGLSDHLPVYMVKKRIGVKKNMEWKHRRSFKNYDIELFSKK